MWPVHLAAVFVLGASLGSFFNVCIYRMPRDLSLSYPGSHCYRCGQPVRWYDNLPLLSYWILRGHCRHCGAPFSIRYFFVELLTMLLIVGVALKIGYSLALIPAGVFVSLLIIGTFTDIDHWIIPDRITLGGVAAGLVMALVWPMAQAPGNPLAVDSMNLMWPLLVNVPDYLRPFVHSLAGAAAGFLVLWLVGVLGTFIFKKEAMGMGDVKLFAMFGAFCGPEPLIYILIIACLIGSVVGIGGILAGNLAARRAPDEATAPLNIDRESAQGMLRHYPLGRAERRHLFQVLTHPGAVGAIRHHLPFGPSLAAAALIGFLFFNQIQSWFERILFSPF